MLQLKLYILNYTFSKPNNNIFINNLIWFSIISIHINITHVCTCICLILILHTVYFQTLKKSGVIAPIQGGYNVQERIRSAMFLAEYDDVLGYLFDGFFTDGATVEEIPSDVILPIINKTMVSNLNIKPNLCNMLQIIKY